MRDACFWEPYNVYYYNTIYIIGGAVRNTVPWSICVFLLVFYAFFTFCFVLVLRYRIGRQQRLTDSHFSCTRKPSRHDQNERVLHKDSYNFCKIFLNFGIRDYQSSLGDHNRIKKKQNHTFSNKLLGNLIGRYACILNIFSRIFGIKLKIKINLLS